MLVQIRLRNFLSFKDSQTFSMVSSNLRDVEKNRIKVEEDFYLLKSASIFGANASGKSNLLKSINFLRAFIVRSFKDSNEREGIEDTSFVLDEFSRDKPTFIEIVFIDKKSRLMRFGVDFTKTSILKEYLYIDEKVVYERNNHELTKINTDYLEIKQTELTWKMTNEQTLFLSVLSSTNVDFAEDITKFMINELDVITCIGDGRADFTKKLIIENKEEKEKILELLGLADFNITNLSAKKSKFKIQNMDEENIPKSILKKIEMDTTKIITGHNVYNSNKEIVGTHFFDAEESESSGTNEFLKIVGPIVDALLKGTTLFIDEIDSQFHPLLTHKVLELFNSEENKHNAQLIITSHNSTLLDNKLLRRDQIWFTEKDIVESSHLTSLSNYRFKGEVVRSDEKYDKNYLQGKYGAIPIIKKDFEELFDEGIE